MLAEIIIAGNGCPVRTFPKTRAGSTGRCLFGWECFASYLREEAHMSHEEKTTRSVKMNQKEVSEEIVNDSLGEVTPADSTGLASKDEARKLEHPA